MRDWTNTYDGVFFINITSLSLGFFGIVVNYCLCSKCDNVNFCFGLVTIHRNVELEVQEEMKELELGIRDEEGKKD